MAENNDFALGYAMGQDSGGNSGGFGFGNDGWGGLLGLIVVAGLFGWGGGFGGFGGGMGGAGSPGFQGMATRADINEAFALDNLNSGITGIANGLCSGFHDQTIGMMNGFNGVQQGFTALGQQLADCCCENRAAIAQVRYDLATQNCALTNTIQNTTRDLIDNQNANARQIMDFLVNDKISALQAENQSLKFAASQAQQNAFITANQEAQTAELIRRLGRDCPIPAYVVPNPNCCYGNPVGVSNGGNGSCGQQCGF